MWGTEGRPASSGEAGAGWAPSGNRLEFLLATGSIDRFNTCDNESFNLQFCNLEFDLILGFDLKQLGVPVFPTGPEEVKVYLLDLCGG